MATAAIAGIGGYTAAIVTVRLGLPYPLALVAAVAMGAITGTMLAIFTAGMRDFILKLATLASAKPSPCWPSTGTISAAAQPALRD